MTTEVASAILDVSPDQVARLCKAGQLPGSKLVYRGKTRRVRWHVDGKSVRARRRRLMIQWVK